jgi:hypothetical protein
MKWFVLVLVFGPFVLGQTVQRYEYDPSGNRVAGPTSVARDGQKTERTQSINGRVVPIEKVEERVIRSDENERVVERVVQRFDPDGRPAATLRFVVEEKKLAGGGSSVRTSVYQSNASGGSQLVERTTSQISKSGDSSTTEMTVERPSVNGSLEPAERRTTVERKGEGSGSSTTAIFRPDANGRFFEAVRETSELQGSGGQVSESSARYEPDPTTGQMRLIESKQRSTVKRADGSESEIVDVYAPSTPGLANQNSRPKIKEQQIIERRPAPGGMVETMAVRRPGLADPDRLGPARTVSETVCRGKCR